jgi:hypothetical protein
MKHSVNFRSGQLSVSVLFFATIAVVLLTGFVFLASSLLQLSLRELNRSQAFTIAESGIEYYRWHLAHAPEDFQDGTGAAGPYVHPYYDKNGIEIGSFTLTITPPQAGSTVVTVRSQGQVAGDSIVSKIIEVRLAIPSFAKYAWALNDVVNFGTTAEVFGPIHSNNGIRFNGLAHNLVTSALLTYPDPDAGGATRYAVHTTVSPSDPVPSATLLDRPDIFMAGRELEVPALDFTKLTQDLADLKTTASSSGLYFPSSTKQGYDLVFATRGIYRVYRVNTLVSAPGGCSSGGVTGWGTWSISSSTLVASGTIPANGTMFFEDNLWVRGQIDGKRVTVASGRFPDNASTRSSVIVNSQLLYTNYDGTDALALIAQNNMNVGLIASSTLRIDAAIIALNGRIGRYSYSSNCGSNSTRTLLTTYGMLGTALRPAFYYSGSNGYQSRSYIYDSNLLYAPPPNFPLTTDQYTQVSWDEVQ